MTRTLPEAPSPAGDDPPRAIRVFFVEDQDIYRDNLAAYLREHPDCGVELVGWKRSNSEDLPAAVRASGADHVLVDLKLTTDNFGHPARDPAHYNGLKACQRLKRELPCVTVVAYTQFPFLRRDARDHGADEFLEKLTGRKLVDALRAIRDRDFRPPPLPDTVLGLKLIPSERLVSIDVQRAPAIDFALMPVAFALLWYLTEERRAGGDGWLTFVQDADPDTRVVQSRWAVGNPQVWSQICLKAGSEYATRRRLGTEDLDRWRNLVNERVKGRLEGQLVIVSGKGPFRAGEHRVTCLRRGIRAEGISIV